MNIVRAFALAMVTLLLASSGTLAQDYGETETKDRGEIKFARGKSGATVKGAIKRGVRDQYLLRARPGQTMSVRLTSDDPKAVFDVFVAVGLEALPVTPENEPQREWTSKLKEAGEYYINVYTSGEGGLYSFEVTITGAPRRTK